LFSDKTKYIKVILPLAMPNLLTYAVPKSLEDEIVIGKRVEVQLGKRKMYTAIVHSIDENPSKDYPIKSIVDIIDLEPIVQEQHLVFWTWMADYYMCTLGEVMDAALPSAFKLNSETSYCKHPSNEIDPQDLNDDEFLIYEALSFQDQLSFIDIQQITQRKTIGKLLKSLIEKGVIFPKESLVERYLPKTQTIVELESLYKNDSKALKSIFDEWKGAPKQMELLLSFFDLSKGKMEVLKSDLLKRTNASPSSLDSLVKKGVFKTIIKQVDRIDFGVEKWDDKVELSNDQKTAKEKIDSVFQAQNIALLHGVTSSGKTLIYVELIKETLKKGQTVLFMVPEIALTTQLVNRLKVQIGEIGVYHSKFNPAERVETWNKVNSGKLRIVVGPRSALFLPFKNLGLIIVDEEHDASYKQNDLSPRFQGRDSAIVMGNQVGAKVILGSATPSLESYYNAKKGKFGLVELSGRYGDVQMPKLEFINLTAARRQKEITGAISFKLKEAIEETLARRGQVILFHNRRGFAPYLSCSTCNWIPFCKNCDVSLTYHKFTNDLRCHYCGFRQTPPTQCGACGSAGIEQKGMGTERIEDDLKLLFPEARIARMDHDTVKTKRGHEKIIQQLEEREIDILVGTQMVTKGLDFGNIELVGVINADALLFFPDFRATERAFQMIMQVAGRAGRRVTQGKVFVQIGDLNHPLVSFLEHGVYEPFFLKEIQERVNFLYPPLVRLIKITLKDKEERKVNLAASHFANGLKIILNNKVVGPNTPVVGRVQNWFIREILLKLPKDATYLADAKRGIKEQISFLNQYADFKQTKVVVDVDV
jgi:primosomal protein N' (replication factor Y)